MTALTITPAALHAALMRIRTMADSCDDFRDGCMSYYAGITALADLFDPAHQPQRDRTVTQVMLDPLTKILAAEEAQPAHAHHLPAGPAEAAPDRSDTPAAAGAPAPEAPPPAQAAAGRTLRRRHSRGEWTKAREDLLRAQGPTETDRTALLARINALPGQPIQTLNAVATRMSELGIRMTDEALAIARSLAGRRGGETARQAHPATAGQRTAAREQALRDLWPDPALTVPQIQARLNALPGAPIVHAQSLYKWARNAGLPTPRPSPRDALPAPASAPQLRGDRLAMPLPIIRPADLVAEDYEEGDARIRGGWNPRQVADYFGCTAASAEVWCRTLREADAVAREIAQKEGAP